MTSLSFGQEQMTSVLISTYWNVNTAIVNTHATAFHVLISTYWNVNAEKRGYKNESK